MARRLFLELEDPLTVARGLREGMFVPSSLACVLGEVLELVALLPDGTTTTRRVRVVGARRFGGVDAVRGLFVLGEDAGAADLRAAG